MAQYTIRRHGMILGTYQGATETEALDAVCKEEGYKNFQESCTKQGLVRDNYQVTLVPEE
jgi:hypothetical protein